MSFIKNIILKLMLITMLLISTLIGRTDIYTYIPKNAPPLLPTLYDKAELYAYDMSLPSYFAGLIEQESCISLRHRRCFSPKSRLYAKRKNGSVEEGAGFLQLTRVYRRSGRLRFDTLTNLTRKYPKELGKLNWHNVYRRGDLQITAGILLWRDNFRRIKRNYGKGMKEMDLIAFADSAYNGGYGGLRKDIRKCIQTKGCNPKVWFGNVERTCTKSKRKLYGNRDACMINREHVYNTILKRTFKYYIRKEFTR